MANIKIENIKPELLADASFMNELTEDASELNVRGGILGILSSSTGLGLGLSVPLGTAGSLDLVLEQILGITL